MKFEGKVPTEKPLGVSEATGRLFSPITEDEVFAVGVIQTIKPTGFELTVPGKGAGNDL